MKTFLTALVFAGLALPAGDPPGFHMWTSAELKAFSKSLSPKVDAQKVATQPLASNANYLFAIAHREGPGQAEWHETQADVFFVESGSAILLLGGRLVNGETVGPHEKRNGQIVGGVRRAISAGDVVRIPPRVPHQLLLNGAKEFNYFVVKIKGY